MRYPTLAPPKMKKKYLFINTRIKLCNLGQFTSFANFTYVRVHLSCLSTLLCLISSIPANVDINKTWTITTIQEPKTSEAWPSLSELSSWERDRFILPPPRQQVRRTVSQKDGNCQQRYGGVGTSLQDLGGVGGYPRHW